MPDPIQRSPLGRRDNIGITRLSVFFKRRSVLIPMRRFFEPLVLGRPFIVYLFSKKQSRS